MRQPVYDSAPSGYRQRGDRVGRVPIWNCPDAESAAVNSALDLDTPSRSLPRPRCQLDGECRTLSPVDLRDATNRRWVRRGNGVSLADHSGATTRLSCEHLPHSVLTVVALDKENPGDAIQCAIDGDL
jgi:hypothetical protein